MSTAREFERVDLNINNPVDLQRFYTSCYPGGSGPNAVLRLVCTLLEKIAEEKGYTLQKPGD